MARTYSVTCGRTTYSTAITILQVVASSAASLEVLRAWVSQDSSTAGSQGSIALLRKSASATVTACVVNRMSPFDTAASATAGGSATAEGTNSDILVQEAFNTLNGWLYLPVPEERITVPAGSTIAIKFVTTPLAASYFAGMVFREMA